ncbi:MAG TPA: hypothetical protein ENJ55_02985 [Rhizobiales bacterium]|nr:hypothetical protein [Hyphomicrobiales bacterium]
MYIPPEKTISVIPDLDNLPTTISWPRNRRFPVGLLVVAGTWMIFAAGIAVIVFNVLPGISYVTVLVGLGIITLTAFLVGLAALRQYASQDEVTIDKEGLSTIVWGWVSVRKDSYQWSQVTAIRQQTEMDDYQALLVETGNGTCIPVALSKNHGRITQIRTHLQSIANL